MSDIKHKTGPKMAVKEEPRHIVMQAETGKFGLEGQPAGNRDRFKYRSMDTAPQDGRPILLFDEKGQAYECYWRRTRQFRKSTWQEIGFWALLLGPNGPLDFVPQGWWRENAC